MVTPVKPVDWPLVPHVSPRDCQQKTHNTTATEKGRQFVDAELSQYHSVNRLCSETPSRRRRHNCPRGFSLTLASVLYQSGFWVNSCLGLALLVWLEKGTDTSLAGKGGGGGRTEFLVWLETNDRISHPAEKRDWISSLAGKKDWISFCKRKGLNF